MTDPTADHVPDGASQLDEIDDGVIAPRPLADRTLGRILVILGLVGLAGSLALAIERYLSLVDPDHQPTCSINALLTCSPAMASDAGSLLGFPNPYIGLGAFPVVVTIGVVLLAVPGIAFPRWFWRTFLVVATAATGLIAYLVYTSLEVLVALCPYCMVVWFATLRSSGSCSCATSRTACSAAARRRASCVSAACCSRRCSSRCSRGSSSASARASRARSPERLLRGRLPAPPGRALGGPCGPVNSRE
ncbi:putative membrane protein [Flavimobilis soli]|uniref:Putative membrane protein n=1 Tax=Flavimobilis soli TaxID=442709 RepID=A0A2A9EFY6_9MICO|nr:vitamin K epoxide reductase family protein [Flavimobilis soli]PFG37844.1 putative membrane protein [Flavimobilis soli]